MLQEIEVGLSVAYGLQRRAYEGGQMRIQTHDLSVLRADSS